MGGHGGGGGRGGRVGGGSFNIPPTDAYDSLKQIDLTDEEIAYLRKYTEDGASSINRRLSQDTPLGEWERHVTTMDSIMDKSTLSHDVRVYRGINGAVEDSIVSQGGNIPGTIILHKPYMSTTSNKLIAGSFSPGNSMMEIRAPKGSKGMSMKGRTSHAGEREILFSRNTKLISRGVEKETTKYGNDYTVYKFDVVK